MIKVSIIIPAYNEEKRIGKTLDGYLSFFEKLKREKIINYEVLVVINNTTDKTEEIVQSFQKEYGSLSYINLPEGGKGNAVIKGFKECLKGDSNLIGFSDADMATPPEEYWKLIKESFNCDVVIADRYVKGGTITPKPSFRRLMAKRAFNIVTRALLMIPFKDTQCGAKVFKRDSLKNTIPLLSMSEWAFDVEILYIMHKNGYKIKRIPINWFDKEYSTINFWKSGPGMVLGIVRLRMLNSHFKFFVTAYDKLKLNFKIR